jgi:hypothetical protein
MARNTRNDVTMFETNQNENVVRRGLRDGAPKAKLLTKCTHLAFGNQGIRGNQVVALKQCAPQQPIIDMKAIIHETL